jgi:protein-L-isoaspartate O-methyltransferase
MLVVYCYGLLSVGMGGAVSSGESNCELVDNLCNEGYITRPEVERAFRVVDRADYMTFADEGDRLEAYEDHAWRRGSIHISAPCIYTKAVEALELKEGVSFLNIGSGTGYLSTMAGLLLGPTGVNHGVELHPANVEYSTEKLAEFRAQSQWYDPLTFCEPSFLVGNALLMSPGHMQYDRVYCGAACPPEHVGLIKSLLKVGGVLVFPVDNKLECVSRMGETEWTCKVVLPSVSFASLVTPSDEDIKQLPLVEFSENII